MATVVGVVILAFLWFERLSPEKKIGLVLAVVSGCAIAAIVLLWHPASIGDVPLASLTLSGLAGNLFWWLGLVCFVILLLVGVSILLGL